MNTYDYLNSQSRYFLSVLWSARVGSGVWSFYKSMRASNATENDYRYNELITQALLDNNLSPYGTWAGWLVARYYWTSNGRWQQYGGYQQIPGQKKPLY
jgi:hypothetical protein